MPAPISKLDRDLVTAAVHMYARRLWARFGTDTFVAMQLPTQPDPVYVTFLGHGGEGVGVDIVRGPGAVETISRVMDGDDEPPTVDVDMLSCSIVPLDAIPADRREILKRSGLPLTRTGAVPDFTVMRPGKRERAPNRSDCRTLLYALNAILAADDMGRLETRAPHFTTRLPKLIVTGEADAPVIDFAIHETNWRGPLQAAEGSAEANGDEPQMRPAFIGLPALDDVASWKDADYNVCLRIARAVFASGWMESEDVLSRFLGDRKIAQAFMSSSPPPAIFTAACDWIFAHYRPSAKSPTLLDTTLADDDLPEAERALIVGRREAPVSLYRVTAVRPNDSLDLVDLVSGEMRTVHDRALSKTADAGIVFAASVYHAGRFHFLAFYSPAFHGMGIDEAIEVLETGGAGRGLVKLAKNPHVCGLLWLLDQDLRMRDSVMPQLANSDSEALVFHEATFSIGDHVALRDDLANTEGVDFDEEEDTFVWTREEERGKHTLPNTVLGNGRLLGDELLVSTNSENRYRAARIWLEDIPGVRFVSVKTSTVGSHPPTPVDDRLPSAERPEIPPEAIIELQASFDAYAMAWADEKVPALGNKTPRQACRTAAGRAQVRMMILTMPEPGGPPGVTFTVPRERLFRDLGISAEGSA